MCTQDQVYAVGSLQLAGFLGGADAAGEGDFFDAALFLEAVKLTEVAADAIYGVLAHVAGVQDHEIRILIALNLGVTGVQDHTSHSVRVVYVHLAPKCPYAGRLRRAPRRGSFSDEWDQGHVIGCAHPAAVDRATHTLPPVHKRVLSR